MKKILFVVTFIFSLLCAGVSYAAPGVIALMNDNKIIIADSYGRYSGGTFSLYPPYNMGKGDHIYGPVGTYGYHDFYDDTIEQAVSIYIEETMMSADDAIDYFSK